MFPRDRPNEKRIKRVKGEKSLKGKKGGCSRVHQEYKHKGNRTVIAILEERGHITEAF